MNEFFKTHWHQIWGFTVAMFGLYFAWRKDLSVGIKGGPTLFHLHGKSAVTVSFFMVLIGVGAGINIPQIIKVNKCLDSGGKFDYEKKACTFAIHQALGTK